MGLPPDIVLSVEGLGKLYARRDAAMRGRLGGAMWRALFGLRSSGTENLRASEFWALNDISFSLERGRALGIIGLNGSGKTTLLRILAGQIVPDRGLVRVTGTCAAMIDLQAGFQPTQTGRENVFLRAAALGFTHKQTAAMADEIIDFAEIGDAINAPMTTYSAGMKMRLAFSVIAMVKPDVLIIDEVLAVGDFRFRQKCLARIREMRNSSAFVFVSHAMSDVSRFCDQVIVLHKGEIAFVGGPEPAISFYQDLEQGSLPPKVAKTPHIVSKNVVDHVASSALDLGYYSPSPYYDESAIGDIDIQINGQGNVDALSLQHDSPLTVSIAATIARPCRMLLCGFTVLTEGGHGVSGFASDTQRQWARIEAAPRKVLAQVTIDNISLNPGRYTLYCNLRDGPELLLRRKLCTLEIKNTPQNFFGIVTIPHVWKIETQ